MRSREARTPPAGASLAPGARPASRIGSPAQFGLLVAVNVFVGAMVGLERTILPLLAEAEFGLASRAAALSFIATFGATKAVVNLLAGGLADRLGRRRVLVAGWLAGLPVPLLLLAAPSWSWVLAANALLGINQGLAWSMTINMKLDLVGPRRRGLAVGLNELAGYGGVALAALASAHVASRTALRPEPFYLGVAVAILGLALSLLARETRAPTARLGGQAALMAALRKGTGGERSLSAASLGGLVTNLKDGVLWGLLPIALAARGFSLVEIGVVVALYPSVWGLAQAVFGPLSDRIGRRSLITAGLALQGVGVLGFVTLDGFRAALASAAVCGLGTAMAYPTLLALVSDVAEPAWRASAMGVYRFWRDAGYAAGAVGAGVLSDAAGVPASLFATAALLVAASIAFVALGADAPARGAWESPLR